MSTMTQKEKVRSIVLAKRNNILEGEHGISEELLDILIDEVEQSILNYCAVAVVPVALNFVWANMVVDLALYQVEVAYTPEDPMDALDPSDLSSVKVGDVSVFVGDKYRSNSRSRILQSHSANLDEIVMNYHEQLNQFRRFR